MLNLIKSVFRKLKPQEGKYYNIQVSDDKIGSDASYKVHLGGGAEEWEERGRFQLYFLKQMGLKPSHKLLDVGCGPGRAAVHFIDYLNASHYFGFDYNQDFIRIAKEVSSAEGLNEKRPHFEVVLDFDMSKISKEYDYALLFSVLNHCSEKQKQQFFRQIQQPMKLGSRIFITHAKWFDETYLESSPLKLIKTYNKDDFNTDAFGWRSGKTIFPIVELTINTP